MTQLSICVPCREQVYPEFAYSLAELTAYLKQSGISYVLHMTKGSCLPQQRYNLVREAQDVRSSQILWLDSDMTFPRDIFQRLNEHDLDIVACTYSTKDEMRGSVAFKKDGDTVKRLVYQDQAIEPIDAIGMGVMLTRTEIFDILPQPWFQFYWDHEYKYFNGEDVYFCEQATDHGYEIYVDLDTSRQIGHCGTYMYKL